MLHLPMLIYTSVTLTLQALGDPQVLEDLRILCHEMVVIILGTAGEEWALFELSHPLSPLHGFLHEILQLILVDS